MTVPNMDDARFEYKYVANERDMMDIEHWIYTHPMGFSEEFVPRRVNSVYFDTIDFDSYIENLSGVSARQKYRLRWYGDIRTLTETTLELKIKRNKYGWKQSFPVGSLPNFHLEEWRDLKNAIVDKLPKSHCVTFDPLIPVALIRYRRRYFSSFDKRIRLTVDTQHTVYDQRLKRAPDITSPTNAPSPLVLEVKFHPCDRLLCSDILRSIPLRQTRHSKYAVSVNSILA